MTGKTIAERREELNRQLAELAIAEIIEDKLEKLTEDVNEWLQQASTRPVIVGYETEQATTYKTGEYLWTYDGSGRYTDAEGVEKFGTADWAEHKKPYFYAVWGNESVPEDELSDDDRNQIKACTAILEHLGKMEY